MNEFGAATLDAFQVIFWAQVGKQQFFLNFFVCIQIYFICILFFILLSYYYVYSYMFFIDWPSSNNCWVSTGCDVTVSAKDTLKVWSPTYCVFCLHPFLKQNSSNLPQWMRLSEWTILFCCIWSEVVNLNLQSLRNKIKMSSKTIHNAQGFTDEYRPLSRCYHLGHVPCFNNSNEC